LITKEEVIEVLKKVQDPELNIDVWTMGLIYDINVKENFLHIKMTFTTPFCPYGQHLLDEVKRNLEEMEGVKEVNVELVLEPAWKPSEELKSMLGI